MQHTDTSTEPATATSAFPFSPLTDKGLSIQINERASLVTYAVVAEARRVYDMCRARTQRILADLRRIEGSAA